MHHAPTTQALTYGLTGIELHRASERRAAEQQRNHVAATLRLPGRLSTIRHRLGGGMIRVGIRIGDADAKPLRIEPGVHPHVDAP